MASFIQGVPTTFSYLLLSLFSVQPLLDPDVPPSPQALVSPLPAVGLSAC